LTVNTRPRGYLLDLLEQVRSGEISLAEAAQRQALAERVERLPKTERERACEFLTGVLERGNHLRTVIGLADNLLAMPRKERLRIYVLSKSDKPRERSLALTEAAKLPPMPHPAWIPLQEAVRQIRRSARHLKDDGIEEDDGSRQSCRNAEAEIRAVIATLKQARDGEQR
jgi:hypothetical protein